MAKNYTYFEHKSCEYYPCHAGAEEGGFNCLFCYCPLYALGEDCGGSFRYLENGVKDCSDCLFPHKRENYAAVLARYTDILAAMKKPERE